jgi:dATP pyrophosphohydrolase
MPGPKIRTDIVEVYVFRRRPTDATSRSGEHGPRSGPAATLEFLQLRRRQEPLANTWQPVMGHVESGESSVQAALRELKEETGYGPSAGLLGFWQLELVNTFYIASQDAIVLCPGFAAEVAADAEPTIDAAHDAARWINRGHAGRMFLWPGQRAAVEHVVQDIASNVSPMESALRISLT